MDTARRRPLLLLLLFAAVARGHWHENWQAGEQWAKSHAGLSYSTWYTQDWVANVRSFYCDETCEARLLTASTIDREFKALVDLFNQTTGGPRGVYALRAATALLLALSSPLLLHTRYFFRIICSCVNVLTGCRYRGAFEGLDAYKAGNGQVSRRAASGNQWKMISGWDTILSAHTSTLALCTELKVDHNGDGNVTFTRDFCYQNINATTAGPAFPSPRWSIINDCCLKFNRTIGHVHGAFFWTEQYEVPQTCFGNERDAVGELLQGEECAAHTAAASTTAAAHTHAQRPPSMHAHTSTSTSIATSSHALHAA